jgi:hypothetical protein
MIRFDFTASPPEKRIRRKKGEKEEKSNAN